MLSKWIWVFFFGCVIFGMWMIYDQGIKPKAITVIKTSNFDSQEQLGELIFTAVRPRLHLHPFAMVGVQDETQSAAVEAFVKATGYEVVRLLSDGQIDEKGILTKLQDGKKVIALATPAEVIHFNKIAAVHKLELASGKESLSFAFVNLPGSKGSTLYESCQRQGKFTHTIGCLLEEKIKIFKGGRRKLNWDQYVAGMEQEGQRTYMVYTFLPSLP